MQYTEVLALLFGRNKQRMDFLKHVMRGEWWGKSNEGRAVWWMVRGERWRESDEGWVMGGLRGGGFWRGAGVWYRGVGWGGGGGELRVLVWRGLRRGIEVRIDTSPTDQMSYIPTRMFQTFYLLFKKCRYLVFTFQPSESREKKSFFAPIEKLSKSI